MPLFARRSPPRARRRLPRAPALTRHEVIVPRLPVALDGITIAHLSDPHVQRLAHPHHLDHAVDQVRAAAPDLVALTGDYVCFHRGAVPRLCLALSRLPADTPAVAVLGNHDHWCDAFAIRRGLERLGIAVLQNEHAVVSVRGHSLLVVGVDDAHTRREDPDKAFHGAPPLPAVALTHDPRAADAIAERRPLLILAGHTHGGQVRVRGLTDRLAARLGQRYLAGRFTVGEDTTLFVSRGLGASLPVRVNAPPEVALLTLRR